MEMMIGKLRQLFLCGCAFLAIALGVSTAEALSCHKPSVVEHIRNSDLVFYGALHGRARLDREKKEWMGKFKVLWHYKGVEGKYVMIKITTTVVGDLDGRNFEHGIPGLFFAESEGVNDSGLQIGSVHYCSMMAYHGRPKLHPKYWYLLNQLE